MTTTTNAPHALRRNTKAARAILDEEIDYCRRAGDYVQRSSRARLEAWGSYYSWVRERVHRTLGTLGM